MGKSIGITNVVGDLLGADKGYEDARDAQRTGATDALKANQHALDNALAASQHAYDTGRGDLERYYNEGRAGTAGYNAVGSNALDQYAALYGVGVPQGGTYNYNNAIQNYQQQARPQVPANGDPTAGLDKAIQQMQHATVGTMGSDLSQPFNSAAQKALQGTPQEKLDFLKTWSQNAATNIPQSSGNGTLQKWQATQQLADNAIKNYQPSASAPTSPAPVNPVGNTPMVTPAGNQVLGNFMQTPEYQLLFGDGKAGGIASDPNASAYDRYMASPEARAGLDLGMEAVNRTLAAQGLTNSGAQQQALMKYGQQLTAQNYNNYTSRLTNAFDNYSRQLASLSGVGVETGMANQNAAMQTGANLGNLATHLGDQQVGSYWTAGGNAANIALGNANALAQNYIGQQNANNKLTGTLIGAAGSAMYGPKGSAMQQPAGSTY